MQDNEPLHKSVSEAPHVVGFTATRECCTRGVWEFLLWVWVPVQGLGEWENDDTTQRAQTENLHGNTNDMPQYMIHRTQETKYKQSASQLYNDYCNKNGMYKVPDFLFKCVTIG